MISGAGEYDLKKTSENVACDLSLNTMMGQTKMVRPIVDWLRNLLNDDSYLIVGVKRGEPYAS